MGWDAGREETRKFACWQSAAIRNVILPPSISPIEQHSKKPDVTRDKIVELAGDLPRVELFARQKIPGWDVWGNEVECDLTLNPT